MISTCCGFWFQTARSVLVVFVVRVRSVAFRTRLSGFDQVCIFFRFIQYFPELADRFSLRGGISPDSNQIENIRLFQFCRSSFASGGEDYSVDKIP